MAAHTITLNTAQEVILTRLTEIRNVDRAANQQSTITVDQMADFILTDYLRDKMRDNDAEINILLPSIRALSPANQVIALAALTPAQKSRVTSLL